MSEIHIYLESLYSCFFFPKPGALQSGVGPERELTPLQAKGSVGVAEDNYWTLPKLTK